MGIGFSKFKQKVRTGAIIRAALTGVSIAAMVISIAWLLSKLLGAQMDFLRYGILGGALGFVVAGILLIFTLPTDKRLAKRLDMKLGLQEKVQTMVAFRKDESDMAVLQREDADRVLQEIPAKKYRSRSAWLAVIAPVLACACLASALLVPAKGAPVAPPDDSWYLSVYDENKLNSLIEYVNTSAMQEAPKQQVVAELQSLLAELKTVKKVNDMKTAVIDSIVQIDTICQACDTYSKVIKALIAGTSEPVQKLGQQLGTLNGTAVTEYVEDLFETLTIKQSDLPETSEGVEDQKKPMTPQERGQFYKDFSAGVTMALEASREVPENLLYMACAAFAKDMEGLTESSDEIAIKIVMDAAENALSLAIKQPGIDVSVEGYTQKRLMYIFGINEQELPIDISNDFGTSSSGSTSDPEEDKEETGTQGGIGNGEFVVGSDDTVYDPATGELVPYGQVLAYYQGEITKYITGGTMDPDMEAFITAYFAALYNSDHNDKTETN